jgi:hypothetical protein
MFRHGESRVKTYRSILVAAAFVAFATTAGLAQHGGGKSGKSAGHHDGSATGGTGKAGAHGIDLVRHDDGYASPRRRATRSSLVGNGAKKGPSSNVARPAISPPGVPAVLPRNAIGAVTTTNTGAHHLDSAHPSAAVAVTGVAAKTSIGGNAAAAHHETPHVVPTANASIHSTGLSGTQMGHAATSPAVLGGAAHSVSGISGASIRTKH